MIIYYTHDFKGHKGESHILLRKVIAQYTGDDAEAAALAGSITTSGEFGKPVIEDFRPFSISHSGATWAVAVSENECGLDLQYYRKSNIEAVAKRFYAEEDATTLKTAGTEDEKEDLFFRIWVRREALIKAVGGSVVASEDVPPVIKDETGYAEVEYKDKLWYLRDISIPGADRMAAAVCLSDSNEQIAFEELRP